MPIKKVLQKPGCRPVKVWTDDITADAIAQLTNIAQLPFIHKHVAAMPDVHLGKGATVGSVIATSGAIIPAAVGVDIGCGMNALRLSLKAHQLPDNLRDIRLAIERDIPLGAGGEHAVEKIPGGSDLALNFDRITNRYPELLKRIKPGKYARQLGTLGSGNHFIELCLDEDDDVWIMLHSGSRGVGNAIGSYFIELAKQEMRTHFINLPDQDLAYLPEGTRHYEGYIEAVGWAQEYARLNRQMMMQTILNNLRQMLPPFTVTQEAINCHHNYIARENHYGVNVWITRKGAIRAREGDLGIIPGSMGTRSYIVRGKGNLESFCSCSHGAGRRLSRTQASRNFTVQDLIEQTQGVECRKDAGVLDEIPAAYKDIDTVMANQDDLVEVVHVLRQVLNVKG